MDINNDKNKPDNKYFQSIQKQEPLRLLSGHKVFKSEILAFFFPTLNESESSSQLKNSNRHKIPKELLDKPFYKELVNKHASLFLEKYLNENLCVELVTYLNKNSKMAAVWKLESKPNDKFDIRNIFLDKDLKKISFDILKKTIEDMLSGSIEAKPLASCPNFPSEVSKIIKDMIGDMITGIRKRDTPSLADQFFARLCHTMYKDDSVDLLRFIWGDIFIVNKMGSIPLHHMTPNPDFIYYLTPENTSIQSAVIFFAKDVLNKILFPYTSGNKRSSCSSDNRAIALTEYRTKEGLLRFNMLTLACMTSHPDIHQARKNDMMKYLLDLFLRNPSYHYSSKSNAYVVRVNIRNPFNDTIEYLADKTSPTFHEFFSTFYLERGIKTSLLKDIKKFGIQILDREAALDYLISILEGYNVEATPYKKYWELDCYPKKLFVALQSAVKHQNQRLFKALIRLLVTRNIRDNSEYNQALLNLAANDEEMTQVIRDYISA